MDIYHYHPQTGELVGKGRADADPLEKDNWLIPAHATRLKPPIVAENQAVVFLNNKWQVVPDHRGQTFYLSDGSVYEGRLNEALPEDASTEKPATVYTLAQRIEQNNATRRNQYQVHVDPLLMEAAVKRAQSNETEADDLTAQALAERERIQAEYPTPVGD